MSGRIVALAGGVGAARFLDGLARVVPPEDIFVVGNTGDDAEIHGLHISPDLDTVLYTLAGLAHREQGWGLQGDSFRCLEALARLGADTWFRLGDLDLATHIFRTERLRRGVPLSEVTRALAQSLGVRSIIAPATDHKLRTIVRTPRGDLEFQDYFVRRRCRDRVLGLRFGGAAGARPAPGVLDAIRRAAGIVLCPSNPFISIGPILAVPGIRNALRRATAPVAAISPIVGGKALKGPAAAMMKSMGMRPSPASVAQLYRDFLDVLVLDRADAREALAVEALGVRAVTAATVMSTAARRRALAKTVVRSLGMA